MTINWKGHSCFQISTSPIKNGAVSIAIDPFDNSYGLRVPKLQADILLTTHDHKDHSNIKAVEGNYLLIDGPGEYDVKEISIQGIPSFHDDTEGKERGLNTIYTIETEDIRICHLGDLGQKELTTDQLEKIGSIDILMIPIGGTYTIDPSEAVKIMGQIEPKIIIPMHYHLPNLKLKLEGIESFLKALGIKKIETLPKLSIKKKDISLEPARNATSHSVAGGGVKIIQLQP